MLKVVKSNAQYISVVTKSENRFSIVESKKMLSEKWKGAHENEHRHGYSHSLQIKSDIYCPVFQWIHYCHETVVAHNHDQPRAQRSK